MLSKNKQKLIRQLASKKHRDELGLFIAEGPKVVGDLLGHVEAHLIFATPEWLETNAALLCRVQADEVIEVTQQELERISLLKTPRDVFAVMRRPNTETLLSELARIARNELTLALDGVQDPGNLGTIIRLADWFGIGHIFCSPDSADAFSPKTIMATMGAIARVKVHYVDLTALLKACENKADERVVGLAEVAEAEACSNDACGTAVPVYGTFLDGTDIYAQELSPNGIIVMGNEGNGISAEVAQYINRRLFIPSFPADRPTSESLNVAIATAITCAEFRRRS